MIEQGYFLVKVNGKELKFCTDYFCQSGYRCVMSINLDNQLPQTSGSLDKIGEAKFLDSVGQFVITVSPDVYITPDIVCQISEAFQDCQNEYDENNQ